VAAWDTDDTATRLQTPVSAATRWFMALLRSQDA
jgi:hypothetical protein